MTSEATTQPPPGALPTRAEAIARLTAPGEAFELEIVEQYGQPCRAFKNAPPTLGRMFEETRSDETFLVYEDERYTFEETYRRAAAIGAALVTELGVGKGDRVAISLRNYPEWVVAFMAATSVGAVAVAMNALWESEEMEYGLRDSGATVLFADQERLDRLAGCANGLPLEVVAVRASRKPEGAIDFEELLARHHGAPMPELAVEPADDAIILYTSGSTGHPKGAVSCHRNVLSALLSWELDAEAALLATGATAPELPHQISTLLAVPLFHATGSHAVYLASYRAQRKIVSMYKWDPTLAAELVEREKITSFIAPAAMTGDLVETARRTDRDLSTLLRVGGGGAPRAPEQVKRIDETFPNAVPGTGWGMTETNAIGTGISAQDYLDRPASSGRCSAVLDLRIVDDAGREVAAGERGELQVRGTSIFRGYWNRPEATADAFAEGRWLHTGDVATVDDDGFLFIVDRIKDLVIRGGENVGCGEVEAALQEHEHVLEASVYSVPDERLGEEVGATVYCDAPVTEDELRAFLAGHLAKFKIPRHFEITTEPLPRIASGKIFKRKIRQDAIERLGAG